MLAAAVVARSDMSPSDQWVHVAEKIDDLARENNRQFAELTRQQQADRHAIRGEMQAVVGRVSAEFSELRKELTGADRRLLVVETERRSEASAITRRAVWISLGISLLGPRIVEIIKELFWWKGQ